MPRNMSFMLTTEQIRKRTKTVTRRLKWLNLKKGDLLNACVKCQGIKRGESIERLALIRVVDVRLEVLENMCLAKYGKSEAIKEGFPNMTGSEFVGMFCENMKCEPSITVTRIEFEYVDAT